MTDPQRPGPADVTPEQLISELLADYNTLNDQAARTRASLAATAGTATGEAVRLVVSASGQLQQVGFNRKLSSVSHTRLSQDFLDTYRKAARAANSSLADASGSLGDQVRASVPEEVSAAPETDPVTPATQAPAEDAASHHVSSVEELPTDPDLDSALDLLEGDDMESFNRFLEHPEVQRLRPGGDPSQWQRDLEEQVRSISSNADQIAEIWRRVEGEADSKAVHLVAEPTGGLVRATFHPTATSLSPTELVEAVRGTYHEAVAAAGAEVQRELAALGLDTSESPTLAQVQEAERTSADSLTPAGEDDPR